MHIALLFQVTPYLGKKEGKMKKLLYVTCVLSIVFFFTTALAEKVVVIPLFMNDADAGNECMTCNSINDVKEICEAWCDGTHSAVPEQLWACYNGCSVTGGILKENYLCPGEDCS